MITTLRLSVNYSVGPIKSKSLGLACEMGNHRDMSSYDFIVLKRHHVLRLSLLSPWLGAWHYTGRHGAGAAKSSTS